MTDLMTLEEAAASLHATVTVSALFQHFPNPHSCCHVPSFLCGYCAALAAWAFRILAIPAGRREPNDFNGLRWNSPETAPYSRQWLSGRFGTRNGEKG